MDTFQFIEHLAVALAISLLIGIERGWKQREEAEGERAAGLRTLALAGLLGGVRWTPTGNETMAEPLELKNPFDLTVVLGFGAMLAAILVFAKALTLWTGTTAVMALAATSGLADVDAITLSMARLGRTDLSAQTAALAILLALGVNSVPKAVLATMAGGREIGALVTTGTALAIAAGLAGLWLAAGWDFGAAGR